MANVFQNRKQEVEVILRETDPWEWGTVEGARRHTLYQGFFTSFLEKIQWLEEMEDLNLKMKASREKGKRQDS